MSDPILDILQHALGTDKFGRGTMYRDYFVAGPGHSDFDTCCDAVASGLMNRHANSHVIGGNVFIVTAAGRTYVKDHSPKVDARQRRKDRYSRYLDISDVMPDLTFREFLRREREFSANA